MSWRKRIFIAWEVGANYGHVSDISQVLPWIGDDFDIIVAVRDPVAFRAMVPDPRVQVTTAPHAPLTDLKAGEDGGLSYADVLRFVGWHDPDVLTAYLESWEVLIRQMRADVVVTHAAPTALLAARALGLPRVVMGGGYDAPPRASPMPHFKRWEPCDAAALSGREAHVVANANAALARRGHGALQTFSDLLAGDRYLLTTVPELDHYSDRAEIEADHPPYLGPMPGAQFGQEVTWAPEADFRIFAYLRPGNARLDTAVRALASLPKGTDIILAVPGAPEALVTRLENTPLRLIPGPVNVMPLLPDCDLGISHASAGLTTRFALSGVPHIGMPNHTEQTMMAHSLSRGHLGLGLVGKAKPEHLLHAIELVRSSEQMASATAAFATRWSATDTARTGQRVAQEIVSLP